MDPSGAAPMPPPPPPPPPEPRTPGRWIRWLYLGAGFVLGLLVAAIGAVATTDQDGTEDVSDRSEAVEISEPTAPPSPSPSPSPTTEAPDPDAEYSSSCDYILGDFTENTRTGYRFIAGADVENTGNVDITVEMVASFEQLGGAPIRLTEEAGLRVGQSRSIQVTEPVGSDEIDLVQSAQDDGEFCKVVVRLVNFAA